MATDSGTPLKLSDAAVKPLRTLDPAAPLDDLEWLDEAIGAARVVAIGESAHGIREFYQLRHRLLRYLVERHGFDAYAMESGFVEGWGVNDWVHGGDDELSQVLATGVTFLMGLFVQMRTHWNGCENTIAPLRGLSTSMESICRARACHCCRASTR